MSWNHLSNEEVAEIKKLFPVLFAELNKIVNDWDPAGFLKLGAPDDEYDCIVGQIIKKELYKESEEKIKEWIEIELDEHFGITENEIGIEYKTGYRKSF